MHFPIRRERRGENRARDWLTVDRLVLYSGTMIVLYVIFLAVWARASHGFTDSGFTRPGFDFEIFWSASYAVLHGIPASQIYDQLSFEHLQQTLFGKAGHDSFTPWLYPPTFLLLVVPFALLPLVATYFLFVGASVSAFTLGTLRLSALNRVLHGSRLSWLLVAASPCVFVPAIFGQNSLLTAALAALAIYWIDRNPVRAGLCIGLLAIKPQMALLFPVLLIAARAWRPFVVAAICAPLFCGLSTLIYGTQSLHAFLINSRIARETLMDHSMHYWLASPTTLAALRVNGIPLDFAYAAQACVALLATVAAYRVWKNARDVRVRGATFFVATLLVNPYVWHYELAWLGVALACLTSIGLEKRWLRGEQLVIVLAWLLPAYEFFNRLAALPQVGPIILLLTLLIILQRVRITSELNA
ncbi:glycosyltransferase family 87 protein [Paraburkholderia terrae]